MTEKRAQRRLAAILAADVVGYSRLMEQDEAGTLAALKARRRDLLVPVVVQHNGRVVNFTGDGVLVEFGSAVDAVQCAVKLQEGFAVANQSLSEKQHIILRIGINLGDIIVEGSDIYGDGVNVAARLEGLAEPGGIYVSASVQEQVSGKLSLAFDDLGEHTLKNIAKPVRIYRAGAGGNRNPKALPLGTTKEKPSVAVLPFVNMSGDPQQEYFSDGITEDIITELSRFRQLLVIARNSSFVFKGKPVDVGEIGRKLGVRYLVEGSIRKSADRIRITAQLINTSDGAHVWADRYDRELKDLFSVQDEVTHTVAATLIGRIEADTRGQLKRKPTDDLDAYDNYLKGVEYHQKFTNEDMKKARSYLENAIALDPEFSMPYPWLALVHLNSWHETKQKVDLDAAFALARRSIALDPAESGGYAVLGMCYMNNRQFDRAETHLIQASNLNPNNSYHPATLCELYALLGRPTEALECSDRAIRLNPLHPDWYSVNRAEAYYVAHRYSEAVSALNKTTGNSSNALWQRLVAAACYTMAGMSGEAKSHVVEVLAARPNFSCQEYVSNKPFGSEAVAALWLEGLLKAGLPP
jgi:adenylate cyclase